MLRVAFDGRAHTLKKTTVLLLEDNRILRERVKVLIDKQADLKIVAASGGNNDILQRARRLKPRVVLVDLDLPGENGLQIVSTLARDFPQTRVIGMSLNPSRQAILELVEAGAAGFVLKDATVVELLGTIRKVARGIKIIPPLQTNSLFAHVVDDARGVEKGIPEEAARMTKREREIIALVSEGMSNKEIALRLHLSTCTVKSHIHNILEKLALHSRLEIATYSYKNKEL